MSEKDRKNQPQSENLKFNNREPYPGIGQRLLAAAVNLFENPWTAAILAGLIYLAISIRDGSINKSSDAPYYNFLADAFLHGQTWLRLIPANTHDLVFYNGKYFLYWAPFPAILLMPFVALIGVNLNDVIYTLLIAAINVGLIAALFRSATRARFINLDKNKRAILVFFFAFGTVHFFLAPFGKVWMTGQLIGFTCTILAYIAVFVLRGWKAWFFTGVTLAAAMLTRTQMVFTGIFPLIYLLYQEKSWIWGKELRHLLVAALPLLAAGGLILYYNQIRFGNPLEMGLQYHAMAEFFRDDYTKYGAFSLHYVPINLFYQYCFYPLPLRAESAMGGSLFLLSPVFFGAFAAFVKPRRKLLVYALLASILITNIPIILLMGTGWVQFGPRYTLDFTVPLLLLTALGVTNWNNWVLLFLTLVSFLQYTLGITNLGFVPQNISSEISSWINNLFTNP